MKQPRSIHRVWLGDREPPHPGFTKAWRALHPGWEVIEWHDGDLRLSAELAGAPTVVHRADITKLAVGITFGGVVVDWDMEPVRNLEPLIGDSDGWCTPDEEGWPGGALFGADSFHPALVAVLAEIRRRVAVDGWHPEYPNVDTGPYAWNAALGDGKAASLGLDILGTTRTAYPIPSADRHLASDPEHMAALRADPDVYAIHHFDGSWIDGSTVRV